MVDNNTVGHAECVKPVPTTEGPCPPVNTSAGTAAVGSTVAGHRAAANGNIAGFFSDRNNRAFIDAWMTGPFHVVAMLDPMLVTTGFGRHTNLAAPGAVKSAATFDVLRGIPASPAAPIFSPRGWPGHGSVSPLTAYTGGERPDPLTPCTGFPEENPLNNVLTSPVGAPITVRIGAFRDVTVTSASLESIDAGGAATALESCAYSANYANPVDEFQTLGRHVLHVHASVALIPRQPLVVGSTYRYDLSVDVAGRGPARILSTFTVGTYDAATAPSYGSQPVTVNGTTGTPQPGVQVEVCTTDGSFCTMATTGADAFTPYSPETIPGWTDVPTSHAFFSDITWMADSGITTGFPDGSFKPSAPISRQAMARFLRRYDDNIAPLG